MPRLASLAICLPPILVFGSLAWMVAERLTHPFGSLMPDEEACLKGVVADHTFTLELRMNEFGLPYHTSTIAPEAHALFHDKPLAMLHFLRGQAAEAEPKTSLRAAAIALEAGKESYSAWFYYVMKQDYDEETVAGNTPRQRLVEMIDNRIKKIVAAEQKTKKRVRRLDRGTLGRERQFEEADPEDQFVVVDLVQTSQGKGYWMR